MGDKSLYEEILEIISAASVRFGNSYVLNDEQFVKVEPICEILGNLVTEFECECVDFKVDDVTRQLTISIECAEMVVENGRTHELFKLIAMLDSFRFSKAKEDTLRVDFTLDNVWECV